MGVEEEIGYIQRGSIFENERFSPYLIRYHVSIVLVEVEEFKFNKQ